MTEEDDGDVQNLTDADRASKFVRKLYQIVCNPQIDDHITWTPAGDAIQILRPAAFARDILPLYFKHSNMRSFIRQLNMYGFRRRGKGSRVIEFVHRRFQRGNERDLASISRNHAVTDDMPSAEMDATTVQALHGELQRVMAGFDEVRARLLILEQALALKPGLVGAAGATPSPSCLPPIQGSPMAPQGAGLPGAGANVAGGAWNGHSTPQWVYVPPAPASAQLLQQPPPLQAPVGQPATLLTQLGASTSPMSGLQGGAHPPYMRASNTASGPSERVGVVVGNTSSLGLPPSLAPPGAPIF